ncbi:NADPH-dependent FMN reductase [Actinomadura alba]|uniref:NAD(P)H-dependent oxidoreductase n=1 Tax=Actinomadura alba TaxID=406431 RepID=A0ABR7LXD2_9ACTN|nr:NAD(P)H-dependent oxidoreductase [Actinomadura alba]MBC6469519.1 NAD(P)H-dependent oxidoreductase [Actinomadura alba]
MIQTGAAAALHVAVIIGSTREGRVGDSVGRWLMARIRRRAEIEPTTIDLADFEFPFHYPCEPTEQMLDLTARIGVAEAFVIVTPVYNRSFPASLKQAIDYAYDEWRAKPVGIVAYGYRSEGLYAMEHLRTVFGELHTAMMRSNVSIDLLDGGFEETHRSRDAEGLGLQVESLLDQLTWWGLALRDGRAARPYVS